MKVCGLFVWWLTQCEVTVKHRPERDVLTPSFPLRALRLTLTALMWVV